MTRLAGWFLDTYCRLRGHTYEPWSPYTRGLYDGPVWQFRSSLWLVEVGYRRSCTRCGCEQFKGVFFDEPAPMPESRTWD